MRRTWPLATTTLYSLSCVLAAEVGDFIHQDEVVVVIETDKVAVEVRSPNAGTLLAQLAAEGEADVVCTWTHRLSTLLVFCQDPL